MRRDPVRADGSRPGPLDALRAAARADGPPLEQRPYALSLMRAVELGETKAAKRGHAIRAARIASGQPAFLPKRSERRREYLKAYHEAHREEMLARMRRYYAENRQRWRDRRRANA